MSSEQALIPREEQALATTSLYEIFAQMARDPSIEPARIQQLMELHERAEKRQAEKEFIAAMTRLQPKLPRIVKRGKIDLGRGKPLAFARYEDVDEVIRPLYTAEGFSVSFGTSAMSNPKDGITITATLSHAAGYSKTESMPLPFDTGPGRNSLQAVGSTLSYGKRYLVCALFNIITVGEDNDGNSVGYIDEHQTNSIIDMFSACEMTPESKSKFLEIMNAESVSEIRKADYAKAMTQLQAKLKKVREGR